MKYTRRLFHYLILVMCMATILSAIGIITDTSIIPSAYAQSCGEKDSCIANGGSWDALSGCSYFLPPMPPTNPCGTITRTVPIAAAQSCSNGCLSCLEIMVCCSASVMYQVYGLNDTYCGMQSVTNGPFCGVQSWTAAPEACAHMCGTGCGPQYCSIIINGVLVPIFCS